MKTPADQPKTPGSKPGHDDVAKRAYAIHVKEGRPQGRDVQNWLEAESKMPAAGAAQPQGEAWHSQSTEDVLAKLGTAATGLSAGEAAKRLAANGPNELKEGKRISPWQIFLSQFKSLIIWILIVAGVISGVLGEMVDAIAILAIVILNAVIGFYQEFNVEKSIAALKKMTAPQAKVRRDGQVTLIPAARVVTGDILALEAGDLVAADARLLSAASLKCIASFWGSRCRCCRFTCSGSISSPTDCRRSALRLTPSMPM